MAASRASRVSSYRCRSTVAAMDPTSSASKRAPAPATSSRSEELSPTTTGAPHRRASNTGSPSPSYSEGNTTSRADCISATRSASLTAPVNITSAATPNSSLRCSQCAVCRRVHVALHDQRPAHPSCTVDPCPGLQHAVQVLAPLGSAGTQHEALAARPELDRRVRWGPDRLREVLARCAVHRHDPFRGDAQQRDQICAGRVRDRQQPIARPQELQPGAVLRRHGRIGQVDLGEPGGDQVVDRRDHAGVGGCRPGRQDPHRTVPLDERAGDVEDPRRILGQTRVVGADDLAGVEQVTEPLVQRERRIGDEGAHHRRVDLFDRPDQLDAVAPDAPRRCSCACSARTSTTTPPPTRRPAAAAQVSPSSAFPPAGSPGAGSGPLRAPGLPCAALVQLRRGAPAPRRPDRACSAAATRAWRTAPPPHETRRPAPRRAPAPPGG